MLELIFYWFGREEHIVVFYRHCKTVLKRFYHKPCWETNMRLSSSVIYKSATEKIYKIPAFGDWTTGSTGLWFL